MFTPRPNRRQLVWARAAQQSGADLVLGAHPHVLQGIGCFGSAPVVYSAGNFVFPTRNKVARRSAIFEITLAGAKVESVRVVPVLLDSKGRPRLATGIAAESIRSEMELLSKELGAGFTGDTASCSEK
jgi:poly-gamma-glutamate synthesis protein (capsule biosynthesis protein)